MPDTAPGLTRLLAQEDWPAIHAWVELHFWSLSGRSLDDEAWQPLLAIPAALARVRCPLLAVLQARWHASADFPAAIEHLDALYRDAVAPNDPLRALVCAAVLEATLARAQSASIASEWIERLRATRARLISPDRHLELYMGAAEVAGTLLLGQSEGVSPALMARCVTLLKMRTPDGLRALAIDVLLQYSLFGRDLPTLRWIVGQIDRQPVLDDLLPAARWRHVDTLAGAYFVLERYDDNQRLLDEAARRALQEGNQQAASACLCAMAQAALGLKDAARAAAAIDRHEAIIDAAEPSDLAMVAANRALLGRLRSDARAAESHARDAVRYADLAELAAYERSAYRSLHAITLTDLGRYAEAADQLDLSAELGPADYGRLPRIEAPLLRRFAQDGDERETARFVVRMLHDLAPEHFGRLFSHNDAEFARTVSYALMAGDAVEVWAPLVERRGVAPLPTAGVHWPWTFKLRLLGGAEMGVIDDQAKPSRRTAAKPMELFQLLAAHAPVGLTVAQLADALWPDAEADLATKNLDVTLVRLRQRLGRDDLIARRAGRLSLNLERLWCDCADLVRRYETGPLPKLNELLDLYRGPLLPDLEHDWVLERRRVLARMAQHVFAGVVERHLAVGDTDAVCRAIESMVGRGLDAEALVQAAVERLVLTQREAVLRQLPELLGALESARGVPAARLSHLARRWGVEH